MYLHERYYLRTPHGYWAAAAWCTPKQTSWETRNKAHRHHEDNGENFRKSGMQVSTRLHPLSRSLCL